MTVIEDVEFVDVRGTLEPRALAAAITDKAHRRVAEALVLTLDWLEEEGREFNASERSMEDERRSSISDRRSIGRGYDARQLCASARQP